MPTSNEERSREANGYVITTVSAATGDEVQIALEDEKPVARGEWATVYRAKLSHNGEIIAIKQVKETSQYKHREMEIMRSMPPNENVVRLQYFMVEADAAAEDTRLLTLFMDYLPLNLHYLIQQYSTGMPISLVRTYVRQLLSGLSHLASQNVVHRDLLPRNILIDPLRGILKLADFGCAKVVTSGASNYPKVGSWQYRAVELLFGATHYDSKADVWSAGIVVLEMVSGRYPFLASSEDEMLESVLAVLGPITIEQIRDIGVNPLDFPELLMSSSSMRRSSDVQDLLQIPSAELRSLLSQALEYSPRRRRDAAVLSNHSFFKVEQTTT